jgi:hypothetical protein
MQSKCYNPVTFGGNFWREKENIPYKVNGLGGRMIDTDERKMKN